MNFQLFFSSAFLSLLCFILLPTMEINGVYYRVLDISLEAQTLRIARKDYKNGICSPEYPNTTINPELLDYSDGANGPGACSASVVVPFPRKLNWTAMNNPSDLGQILKEGFVLAWKFGGVPCQDCANPEGSCGLWFEWHN
ncbi:hypothetical protein ACOSQ4_026492 [Xanthoceras sorbifolium]